MNDHKYCQQSWHLFVASASQWFRAMKYYLYLLYTCSVLGLKNKSGLKINMKNSNKLRKQI